MLLRAVFFMASVLISGVRAGIPTDLLTSNEGSCFCPVDQTGGKCNDSKYKEVSSTQGLEACREYCSLEPGDCRGFAYNEDKCLLYRSVPGNVVKASSDDQTFQCYALNGSDGGNYALFPPGPPAALAAGTRTGGKCKAPINSGTSSCSLNPLYTNCATGKRVKEESNPLQACKDWCTSRGTLCNGFDYDEGAGRCTERRYTPYGAYYPTSRKDYTDWFCHEKTCNCGQNDDDDDDDYYDDDDDEVSTSLCTPMLNLIINDEVCLDTDDVCEATANLDANGKESCNDWCERSGLVCAQAWNDGRSSCEKKKSIGCGQTGKKYSICRCEKPQ